MKKLWCLWGVWLIAGVSLPAQTQLPVQPPRIDRTPPVPQPTGMVTGRVTSGDTQRPARFAEVTLMGASPAGDDNRRTMQRFMARTDLDGMFSVSAPVGDYYAAASATGYVSRMPPMMRTGSNAEATSNFPLVHVSVGMTSTVNLTMERGGTIAGKVTWDDGSPATGVQVNATAAALSSMSGNERMDAGRGGGFQAMLSTFGGFTGSGGMTDDRGQFRLTGLAAGAYVLQAVVSAPAPVSGNGGGRGFGRTTSIIMYAPGKVRRMDAAVVNVSAGEERTDVTLLLDMRSLHRVSGHVAAVAGGAAIGTGIVLLLDTQDRTLMRTGQIGSDGSFTVPYVPSGTYTLSVPSAGPAGETVRGGGRQRGDTGGSGYQPFQMTLAVADGDVGGVNIELTPATAAK